MLWFLFVFSVLVIFIPYISEHLQISKPLNIPHKIGSQKLVFPDYIIIFVSLYLSAIILYFYIEFIKINTSLDNENKNPFLTKETNDETEKEEIFETLYSKTINYLENTKAYKNPEFSRKKLAFDLNTNETYVSIALSKKGIKNFNNLINTYRINQVKEDISKNKNSLNKIYLDAGFTHQSTFNRVFKEIVGITPSEYMKNHIVFK